MCYIYLRLLFGIACLAYHTAIKFALYQLLYHEFIVNSFDIKRAAATFGQFACTLHGKHKWFQVNKLSVNIAKTNLTIFCNKQCEGNHAVSVNVMNINRVDVTKFIGVHIDSHLNWCEHINHVKSNIQKNCLVQ